jgi:hypothetical protein
MADVYIAIQLLVKLDQILLVMIILLNIYCFLWKVNFNMNGFALHNIKHMSPSSVNMWAECPGAWVAKYLYGHQFKFGVAPQIGVLVEKVVANALLERMTLDEAILEAEKTFNKSNALGVSEKDRARVDDIRAMAEIAYAELKPYGKPDFDGEEQHKIELLCKGDGWELPVIGFLDFKFPEHGLCIDLKTTLRIPSTMSDAHRRQQAIYKKALGNYGVKFLYVSPKKASLLDNEDDGESLRQIKAILNRQERFLRLGDAELLKAVVPCNASSFYWNGEEANRFKYFGI